MLLMMFLNYAKTTVKNRMKLHTNIDPNEI